MASSVFCWRGLTVTWISAAPTSVSAAPKMIMNLSPPIGLSPSAKITLAVPELLAEFAVALISKLSTAVSTGSAPRATTRDGSSLDRMLHPTEQRPDGSEAL